MFYTVPPPTKLAHWITSLILPNKPLPTSLQANPPAVAQVAVVAAVAALTLAAVLALLALLPPVPVPQVRLYPQPLTSDFRLLQRSSAWLVCWPCVWFCSYRMDL